MIIPDLKKFFKTFYDFFQQNNTIFCENYWQFRIATLQRLCCKVQKPTFLRKTCDRIFTNPTYNKEERAEFPTAFFLLLHITIICKKNGKLHAFRYFLIKFH